MTRHTFQASASSKSTERTAQQMRSRGHHRGGGNEDSPFRGYWPRSHSRDRHGERYFAPHRTEHHDLFRKQEGELRSDQRQTVRHLGNRPKEDFVNPLRNGEADADLGLKHVIVLVRGSLENTRSASPYGAFLQQAPQLQHQQQFSSSSTVTSSEWHVVENTTVSSASATTALVEVKTSSTSVAAVQYSLTTQVSAEPQDTTVTRPIKETRGNDPPLITTTAYAGSITSLQHFQAVQFVEKVSDELDPAISAAIPPLMSAMASTVPVLCLIVCFCIWVRKRGTRSQRSKRAPPLVNQQSHQVAQPLLIPNFPDSAETTFNNMYDEIETPPQPRQLPGGTILLRVARTRNEQCPLAPLLMPTCSAAISPVDPTSDLPESARSSVYGYEEPLHCNYYRTMVRNERHSFTTSCDNVQDIESLR